MSLISRKLLISNLPPGSLGQKKVKNIVLRSTTWLWIFTCHTLIINLVWLRRTNHDKVPIRLPRVILRPFWSDRNESWNRLAVLNIAQPFVNQSLNTIIIGHILKSCPQHPAKCVNCEISQLVRAPTSWSPLHTTIRTVRFWFGTRRTLRLNPSHISKRTYSRTLIAPRPQPPKKEKKKPFSCQLCDRKEKFRTFSSFSSSWIPRKFKILIAAKLPFLRENHKNVN